MSLATPMTSVGMSRRGDRPRIRSAGGREDAGFAGDESASEASLVEDDVESGCSWYGSLGSVRLQCGSAAADSEGE